MRLSSQNQPTFQGSWDIAGNILFRDLPMKRAAILHKEATEAFEKHQKEIDALPEKVELVFMAHDFLGEKHWIQAHFEPTIKGLSKYFSINLIEREKTGPRWNRQFEPADEFVQKAIAKAKEMATFFKSN